MNDEIRIENLEVYAYHGVFPEEKKQGQPFFLNVTLHTDTRQAGLTGDLTKSIHYGEVCQKLDEWMKEKSEDLLETVAEKLTKMLLLTFSRIDQVDFEIRKPYAPIGLPFESVSVKIQRGWHKVYLSIGSNLGDKEQYIRSAIEALEEDEEIRKVTVSNLLVTKPYGGVEQDDFLNGAIALETMLDPEELLERLHQIEAAAGRTREIHWGPRTLDLDIVFYDKLVYESEDLIIPHIDMQNRVFVLKPLAELAPNMRHPILGLTVGQMLEGQESEGK